jgi:hypothetical protein
METEGRPKGGLQGLADVRLPQATCAHTTVQLRLEAESRRACWACEACGVLFAPGHGTVESARADARVVRQGSPESPAARPAGRLRQEAQGGGGAVDPEAVSPVQRVAMGQLVGLAECAEHLGLASRGRRPGNRLWELLRAGKLRGLPYLRLGRTYRFDLSVVEDWVKRQAANGANGTTRLR